MPGCCARAVPAILLHLNFFLAAHGGAELATGARLKWDPSTYVVLRELFPLEYRVVSVLVTAHAGALFLLPHLAAFALLSNRAARTRRILLYWYAALMAIVLGGAAAACGWLGWRVAAWVEALDKETVQQVLEIKDHLTPILQILGRWHPLPTKLKSIIAEAEADAPRNGYVAIAVGLFLHIMQVSCIILALVSARTVTASSGSGSRRRRSSVRTDLTGVSRASSEEEKAPLKAVYKNGRLQMA